MDQLLLSYEFYGSNGIYLFIFASCEPLKLIMFQSVYVGVVEPFHANPHTLLYANEWWVFKELAHSAFFNEIAQRL